MSAMPLARVAPPISALIQTSRTNPSLGAGSYFRIDGPRVWIEAIVQTAVVFRNEGLGALPLALARQDR